MFGSHGLGKYQSDKASTDKLCSFCCTGTFLHLSQLVYCRRAEGWRHGAFRDGSSVVQTVMAIIIRSFKSKPALAVF